MDVKPSANTDKAGGISRREFARRAALASAVAAVAPTVAIPADTATPVHLGARRFDPSSSAALPPQAADSPKLSPEGHAEAEARLQTILAQYGSRLSDAQKTDLHRLCTQAQPPLDRLRAYALENGDAPALYLKPLVEHDKNPLENTRAGKTPNAVQKP